MSVNNSNRGEESRSGLSGRAFLQEHLSAYVDKQLDEQKMQEMLKIIESDDDMHNRAEMEIAVKQLLKTRLKRIETPPYLLQNVHFGINKYKEDLTKKNNSTDFTYTKQQGNTKRRNYLYAFGGFIAVLLILFFVVNFVFNTQADKDWILASHNIFGKIANNQETVPALDGDEKTLERKLEQEAGFDVFIPTLKDAVLVGGKTNDINGVKVVHFIHKKNDKLIATFQTSKDNMLDDNNDKLILAADTKNNVKNGKNWFPCGVKKGDQTGVVWHVNNVICCSVAYLNPSEIQAALTNIK